MIAMNRLIGIALALAFACSSEGPATQPPDADADADAGPIEPGEYEDPLVLLSRMPGSTFIEIQEVRARADGTVGFCTGVQGLRIIDASSGNSMQSRGSIGSSLGNPRFPRCQHLAFDGDMVYVTNKGDEIQPTPFISAVSVAGQLREVATHTKAGRTFEGIAAAEGIVYAAMHSDGLAILRRSGDRFDELGTVGGLTNAWGVAARGTTVYVADGAGGLAVIDASAPSQARVVGRVETGGVAQSVVLDGDTAFVAAGSVGLVAIDVSNPQQPAALSTTDTPGSAMQVAISNGRAYIADWNDIRVIDVSDPSAPAPLASERIETDEPFSRVLGLDVRGETVFAGEWTGLYAYEFKPERSAPDIGVAGDTVEFGNVDTGETDAVAVILRNDGNEPLVAYELETVDGPFDVNDTSLVLAPGERGVVEVTYSPKTGLEDHGELIIRSDDPDEGKRRVPLVGNRLGFGVGDTAENVRVRLLGGGVFNSEQEAGNIVVLAYFATF